MKKIISKLADRFEVHKVLSMMLIVNSGDNSKARVVCIVFKKTQGKNRRSGLLKSCDL